MNYEKMKTVNSHRESEELRASPAGSCEKKGWRTQNYRSLHNRGKRIVDLTTTKTIEGERKLCAKIVQCDEENSFRERKRSE